MAYTNFGGFIKRRNTQLVNENVDKVVEAIIKSDLSSEDFYTECLLPILTESNAEDPLELLVLVEGWFSNMFGGNKQAPAAAPAAVDPNQAFQQKHGDTFNKVKGMFVNSLKKAASELQNNVARYPNAKMMVPAIQALVNNASNATQTFQFKQGNSSDYYNRFQSDRAKAGQQNAVMGAANSNNTKALLGMPDAQIIKAIEDQPQMRQQLTQLAKNLNQQVQTTTDPAQKQDLQKQLKRVLALTKFGMGWDYKRTQKLGQTQRDSREASSQAAKSAADNNAALAAQKKAFVDDAMEKMMKEPGELWQGKNYEDMEAEAEKQWQSHLSARAQKSAAKPAVRGGAATPPPVPGAVPTVNTESVNNEGDALIESLIRFTRIKK